MRYETEVAQEPCNIRIEHEQCTDEAYEPRLFLYDMQGLHVFTHLGYKFRIFWRILKSFCREKEKVSW